VEPDEAAKGGVAMKALRTLALAVGSTVILGTATPAVTAAADQGQPATATSQAADVSSQSQQTLALSRATSAKAQGQSAKKVKHTRKKGKQRKAQHPARAKKAARSTAMPMFIG
jgi:hypothetical protein